MRELKDIQMEYSQLCSQAGDLQYKVLCFQDQLKQMNDKIRELNQEAIALKEVQDGSSKTEPTVEQSTSETCVPASVS